MGFADVFAAVLGFRRETPDHGAAARASACTGVDRCHRRVRGRGHRFFTGDLGWFHLGGLSAHSRASILVPSRNVEVDAN